MARRFKHTTEGIAVDLDDAEREALGAVLDQFRELLMMDNDPNLTRLKPPAHPDDPEANHQYREMVGDELLRQRLEAVEIVEAGIDGATLDNDAVQCWMQTLNGVRLFLGDRLGIEVDSFFTESTEEENELDEGARMLYEWLGWLLEQLVRAATVDLPEVPDLPD